MTKADALSAIAQGILDYACAAEGHDGVWNQVGVEDGQPTVRLRVCKRCHRELGNEDVD